MAEISQLDAATVECARELSQFDSCSDYAALLRVIDAQAVEIKRLGALVANVQALKPVAWVRYASDGGIQGPLLDAQVDGARRECWTPLVAADWVDRSMPNDERQAVLLTDEQINAISRETDDIEVDTDGAMEFARAIEAAVLAANRMEVTR